MFVIQSRVQPISFSYATKPHVTLRKEQPMLTQSDATGAIDELSTERVTFHTKPHIKDAIQRAAALSGVEDSVFIMNAAYKAAMETIAGHEHTILEPVDHQAFFAALDRPPAPTERLRAAFSHHKATHDSR
jgi:uncharacterized protein (DUF1778 family)